MSPPETPRKPPTVDPTPPPPDAPVLLGPAAKRLSVSPYTLRTWAVYQRRLPYLRLGRKLGFRPQDLADFEQSCLVPARLQSVPRPRRATGA